MHRRTEARIDLAAIRANFRLAARLAPRSRNIAVIKANAYGHGLLAVAEALDELAPAYAVAILEEAIELREHGVSKPLLVLEGVHSPDALTEAAARGVSLVLHSPAQLDMLLGAALGQFPDLWLKVDTGMHRLGFMPAEFGKALERLMSSGRLKTPPVVCTHLAAADMPANTHTAQQLREFTALTGNLELPLSIGNSAAILAWPESHADWNRPGYMLYGNSPLAEAVAAAGELRPAMHFEAELIALREVASGERVGYGGRWRASGPSTIGTVAVGYADGYPRHAPDGTPTLVNGRIAPLAGVVSMDMITIDLTGHPAAKPGDRVTLWGDGLPVGEVARHTGTIGYELLTRVTDRVPRVFEGRK
ncbi:MAG: alanine racemase [Pseudomonadota bacterium]